MRALLVALIGCTPAPSSPPAAPGPGSDSDPTVEAVDTGEVAVPEPTAPQEDVVPEIGVVEADCTALAPLPATYTTLPWVPSSEDFAFDADGNELGISDGTLFVTPFGGPQAPAVPGFSDTIRGARLFADGTMAVADAVNATLLGVDPATGGQWVIASDLDNPNGVIIGGDGKVYVSVTGEIVRVDPATGAVESIAKMPAHSFNGLTFSPDYTRLYWNEDLGKVWYVDLDATGAPGAAALGVDLNPGPFSLLNGVTADACGNLYVVEMAGIVWRITPDFLDVQIAVEIPGFSAISAVNFGSGVGGWDAETLYVMDMLGKLHAAPLGVPGKWEPYRP